MAFRDLSDFFEQAAQRYGNTPQYYDYIQRMMNPVRPQTGAAATAAGIDTPHALPAAANAALINVPHFRPVTSGGGARAAMGQMTRGYDQSGPLSQALNNYS